MSFRMGGLFIQARVENGTGTFELGSYSTFANSINSVSLTMSEGGSSTIQLSMSPTFTGAVDIIESGLLGYGFPIEKTKTQATLINNLAGVFQLNTNAIPQSNSKSSSLSVRFGYGDIGADPKQAITPWINGIVMFPDISFGEEISITMNAVSAGIKMASNDTVRKVDNETLYSLARKIVREEINGTVNFSRQAELKARQIRINSNQTENSFAYLKNILSDHNFKFYESGGTAKDPKITFELNNLPGILNGDVKFTLVMYGQIDIPNKVYPVETFETNINHTQVSGSFNGNKTTNVQTDDKETRRDKADVDEFKKEHKASSETIQGKLVEGKATAGGVTDGPPSLRDRTRAGKRKITVKKERNDTVGSDNVKSNFYDALTKALTVTVNCPLIPEALPNDLINLEIFTGNPNRPKFNTVSGVYMIHKVTHSVSDSGGSTTLELRRELGAISTKTENIAKTSQKSLPSGSVAIEESLNLVGGIFA